MKKRRTQSEKSRFSYCYSNCKYYIETDFTLALKWWARQPFHSPPYEKRSGFRYFCWESICLWISTGLEGRCSQVTNSK